MVYKGRAVRAYDALREYGDCGVGQTERAAFKNMGTSVG